MNWDSSAPLELLAHMPSKLTSANLKKIQEVIDKNKLECSAEYNRDLCGEYAPFCFGCKKTGKYPCAVAYVKMMQAEGVKLEIAATDLAEEEPSAEPAAAEPVEEKAEPAAEIAPAVAAVTPPKDEYSAADITRSSDEPVAKTEKKRIRIAIARRKK